jgi:hypothetical protein
VASVGHLTKRFFASWRPGGPPRAEVEWVSEQLSPAELDLWTQMPGPDRRHSAQVARRVERQLGHQATPPILAAALLHDVGKTQSGLGTYGRVIATFSGAAVGRDSETIKDWTRTRGFTRKVGLYLQHPKLGGDLLGMAGSDPLTETWAREHHLPEDQWTIDPEIGRALKAADDD